MKKLFLILVLVFVALGSWGQESKPTLAVYTTKVDSVVSLNPMTSQIIKSLMDDYRVVGRSGEFQKLIDEEFGYQSGGNVDDKQLAQSGRQFGVDFICAIVVQKFEDNYYFEARIISVENADVVAIADYDCSDISITGQRGVGKVLVKGLIGESIVQRDDAIGTHNGHEWVDLGLSVKWATCNVGAYSPEGYGKYYGWGEVTTCSGYEPSSNFDEKSWEEISGDPSRDAATANWGGNWRMPTLDEYNELIDCCNWTWIEKNGHKGYQVTSKKNGQSIFLPAAGVQFGSFDNNYYHLGNYWSSTPGSKSYYAYLLKFQSDELFMKSDYRGFGRSVRPVLD